MLRRVLGEEVGDRRGDDLGAGVELGVQRVEEVMAVTGIELPRVFAVERDHRKKIAVDLDLADPVEAAEQVTRSVDG